MKVILAIAFALGLVLGCWRPWQGPVDLASGLEGSAPLPQRSGSSVSESVADPAGRMAKPMSSELHERLAELVKSGTSSGLSAEQFFTGKGIRRSPALDKLCEWAALDDKGKAALSRILQESADDRRLWEKKNVKGKLVAPGKWTLEFPGDQGQAKRELRERLRQTFDPETVEAIEAGGDLENFFGFEGWAPEFTHGTVTVITSRKSDGAMDPQGQTLCMEGSYDDAGVHVQAKVDSYMNVAMIDRLTGLLGSQQEVLNQATEASRSPAGSY